MSTFELKTYYPSQYSITINRWNLSSKTSMKLPRCHGCPPYIKCNSWVYISVIYIYGSWVQLCSNTVLPRAPPLQAHTLPPHAQCLCAVNVYHAQYTRNYQRPNMELVNELMSLCNVFIYVLQHVDQYIT